ncbi:MAG: aminopeptidase P family protein [Schwartzia sp.]|nr:aminopeptidase P family protein [Schwartzia sp. (in: firmicutes)]
MIEERLSRLRDFLRAKQADAVVVSKEVNLHYFSGFRGDDTLLLVSPADALLITDSRYTEQAKEQAPLFEIVEQKEGILAKAVECVKTHGWKKLAFEGNAMLYDTFVKFGEKLEKNAVLAISVHLDALREVKEAEEIAAMKKAAGIGDAAFSDIVKFIRPGISEREVAARLEGTMRALGSERPAFTTIVASGARGSLPHGIATEKLIVSGEFVTMDFGAVYEGYHSDMTRTVCVGRASGEQRALYQTVLDAQRLGVSLVKPGASGKGIDAAVRERLKDAGYDEFFGHGLGHSLGLEIHEEPRLSKASTCEHLLPGMVVTVEPGVYLPGKGGLRIEDTVLVTETDGVPLTKSGKELMEIL